jgi:hypothetical protein
MGAPRLGGITKLEIRNIASGAAIGNGAFGTATLELFNVAQDSEGVNWEPETTPLASEETYNTGGVAKGSFKFYECQPSSGATEANMNTDMNNNVRVQVKATYANGTVVLGGTDGMIFSLKTENAGKKGAKMYTLTLQKYAKQRSDLITEA